MKSKHYSAKRVFSELFNTRCQASTKSVIDPTHTRIEAKVQGTPRFLPRRVGLVQAREHQGNTFNIYTVLIFNTS